MTSTPSSVSETVAAIAALPKVVLHDHLDGGLRPQTIIELAAEIGHDLPATDADALGAWFVESADAGSLVRPVLTTRRLACRKMRDIHSAPTLPACGTEGKVGIHSFADHRSVRPHF